jgi:hypothetical protein
MEPEAAATVSIDGGLVLLVDDVRSFRDGRRCEVARTVKDALTMLHRYRCSRIEELWLDHDLGRYPNGYAQTVMPVIEELVYAAKQGSSYDIGLIYVHTSSPVGAVRMRQALVPSGYRVTRHYDKRVWHNNLI